MSELADIIGVFFEAHVPEKNNDFYGDFVLWKNPLLAVDYYSFGLCFSILHPLCYARGTKHSGADRKELIFIKKYKERKRSWRSVFSIFMYFAMKKQSHWWIPPTLFSYSLLDVKSKQPDSRQYSIFSWIFSVETPNFSARQGIHKNSVVPRFISFFVAPIPSEDTSEPQLIHLFCIDDLQP